ncbi:hypothetical protein KYK29_02235 [Shinella daejeonensis]|uniref:hypothetical protein n=1 Tax=Shinella daejeonensis TaxID=659017 RepID=UPI0020C771A3|nr:hypothetical protein [Shinella daejeonensis]MCP8893732.1 hypothetical protein [Shinella daejeonensis]
MSNFLPPLHEGHAPITLQQLFGEALHALDAWEGERAEPAVIYEDRLVPISAVFENMRACTDILPRTMAEIIADKVVGSPPAASSPDALTFADAAQTAITIIEQHRLYGESAIASFLDHHRVDKRRPA